jgi:hypothetical protein
MHWMHLCFLRACPGTRRVCTRTGVQAWKCWRLGENLRAASFLSSFVFPLSTRAMAAPSPAAPSSNWKALKQVCPPAPLPHISILPSPRVTGPASHHHLSTPGLQPQAQKKSLRSALGYPRTPVQGQRASRFGRCGFPSRDVGQQEGVADCEYS